MRSKLFVPGARPELFAKALASGADAVSIDLEDSVPEVRKAEARDAVARFLATLDDGIRRPAIIVRTNALDTPHFAADVEVLLHSSLAMIIAMINLPKPESADDVRAAVDVLARAERAAGVAQPIPLLANIETPTALRRAAEIGAADPRVAGLQLGLGDLLEPLGIDRHDTVNVHAAMWAVRMAAGEARVFAVDGAFANVQDPDGYRAEARMARRLGYVGKSCIHPSQVALANEVFAASDDEVAQARRIVAGARDAADRRHGAFVVDGRMIDAPFLRRAEAIVAAAGRAPAASPSDA